MSVCLCLVPTFSGFVLCFCLSVCVAVWCAGPSGNESVRHWLLASPGNRPGRVRARDAPRQARALRHQSAGSPESIMTGVLPSRSILPTARRLQWPYKVPLSTAPPRDAPRTPPPPLWRQRGGGTGPLLRGPASIGAGAHLVAVVLVSCARHVARSIPMTAELCVNCTKP